MKKAYVYMAAVLGFSVLLGAAVPASADYYQTKKVYHKEGFYDEGRKTYNMFNGDQPTGPSKPYQTRSEKVVVIDEADRQTIHTFVNERSYCPAGISKADCMAKARHSVRYDRGEYIPGHVVYQPLPSRVVTRLERPVAGADYVVVDNNVYLINPSTRQVLDSVYVVNE